MRRHVLLSTVAVAGLSMAALGCNVPSNAPETYNDLTKSNFVAGCTGNFPTSGGTTTSLAPNSVCECQYQVFVSNVPYNDADKSRIPNYSGKTFTELNTELQRDPNKITDTAVITQPVQDKLKSCVQSPTAITPGSTPGPGGTTAAAPGSTTGTAGGSTPSR